MSKRKSITKKTRFEVFKRDSFTCQYCGKSAPDIILEVDHIKPVSKGGDNNMINLITSCFDCNRGKGKNKLSDGAELKKQMQELELLNVKAEQLKMIAKWREGLLNLKDVEIDAFINYIGKIIGEELSLTPKGKNTLLTWVKKYDYQLIYEAIERAFSNYYKNTDESFEITFRKIGGILYNISKPLIEQYVGKSYFTMIKNNCGFSGWDHVYLKEILNSFYNKIDESEYDKYHKNICWYIFNDSSDAVVNYILNTIKDEL